MSPVPKKQATRKSLQNALTALLQDTALHQRVRAMARKLQTLDSHRLTAEALEQLVADQTPRHSTA